MKKDFFESVPIGGETWVPDDPVGRKGNWILDRDLDDDGTKIQMESFIADVRNNRIDPFITKQGFYASIATLMGFEAMKNNEITYWPKDLVI